MFLVSIVGPTIASYGPRNSNMVMVVNVVQSTHGQCSHRALPSGSVPNVSRPERARKHHMIVLSLARDVRRQSATTYTSSLYSYTGAPRKHIDMTCWHTWYVDSPAGDVLAVQEHTAHVFFRDHKRLPKYRKRRAHV